MSKGYEVLQNLRRERLPRLTGCTPTRRATGEAHPPFLTPERLNGYAEQIEAAVDQGWSSEQWPEEIPVETEKENTNVSSAT